MHVIGVIRRPHQSEIVIGFVTGIVIGVMVISVVVIILIERVEIAYKKICGRSSLPEGIVRGVVFYNIIVSGFIIEIVIGFVVIIDLCLVFDHHWFLIRLLPIGMLFILGVYLICNSN